MCSSGPMLIPLRNPLATDIAQSPTENLLSWNCPDKFKDHRPTPSNTGFKSPSIPLTSARMPYQAG